MKKDGNGRVRFGREGHRFYVTKSNVRVYDRADGYETDVTPQKRTGMIRKYKADIEKARIIA